MKPDWKDAPEWAKYLAMDSDGRWFWYDSKPETDFERWRNSGLWDLASYPEGSWRDTLDSRPT